MAGTGGLAKQVRAGLNAPSQNEAPPSGLLDELFFGKTKRERLKEFGEVFALICLVIADVRLYNYGFVLSVNVLLAVTALLLYLGFYQPLILHPAWKAWMKLGHALGMIMSVVILGLAWVVMMIPISAILKVFKIRVMDTAFGSPIDTYWENRDKKLDDFALLRRQF
jgi:hypothetical protein